jgi:uncharacterized membrane protein
VEKELKHRHYRGIAMVIMALDHAGLFHLTAFTDTR